MKTDFLENSEENRLNRLSGGFRRGAESVKSLDVLPPEMKTEKQSTPLVKKKNKDAVLSKEETSYEKTFFTKKDRTTESTINIRISRDEEKVLRKILFAYSQTANQRISVGQFIDNILKEHMTQYEREIENVIKDAF